MQSQHALARAVAERFGSYRRFAWWPDGVARYSSFDVDVLRCIRVSYVMLGLVLRVDSPTSAAANVD